MDTIWISPSDLSYFWSDSKVGFYDKYVLKIQRPKLAFPSVFNTIDLAMKDAFEKVPFCDIVTNAPEGTISHSEIYVQSNPIKVAGKSIGFKGKLDCLLVHDDGTHSIIDYKTTHISSKLQDIYFLQLMAYAYCLENPLRGEAKQIRSLGLLVFDPKTFEFENDKGNLKGELAWLEIPFDKNKFKKWITKELAVLFKADREQVFASSTDLSWEKYVNAYCTEEE